MSTALQEYGLSKISKRIKFNQMKDTSPLFYLRVSPPAAPKKPLHPLQPSRKTRSLTNLKLTPKPKAHSLKSILESMDPQAKINFYSDIIYLRKNLFNPQIKKPPKVFNSLKPEPSVPSLIPQSPSRPYTNFLIFKKLHASAPAPARLSLIPPTQKIPQRPIQSYSLVENFEKYVPKPKPSQKLPKLQSRKPTYAELRPCLSPGLSFDNDIEGWT